VKKSSGSSNNGERRGTEEALAAAPGSDSRQNADAGRGREKRRGMIENEPTMGK